MKQIDLRWPNLVDQSFVLFRKPAPSQAAAGEHQQTFYVCRLSFMLHWHVIHLAAVMSKMTVEFQLPNHAQAAISIVQALFGRVY